jgi:hypothetical protein
MATLSTIATAHTILFRLGGRFPGYGGIPGAFSGGGLAGALWSLDWPASATSLSQAAFLASFLLLVAAMNGGGLGELAGARRALRF